MDLRAAKAKRDGGGQRSRPVSGGRTRTRTTGSASDLFRSTWDSAAHGDLKDGERLAQSATPHQQSPRREIASPVSEGRPSLWTETTDGGSYRQGPTMDSPTGTVARSAHSSPPSGWSRRAGPATTKDQSSGVSGRFLPAKLLPPVRKQDGGFRWLLLTAARYPLQVFRHWQSVTILLVYLCIVLMLYDLHLRREYRLSLSRVQLADNASIPAQMGPTEAEGIAGKGGNNAEGAVASGSLVGAPAAPQRKPAAAPDPGNAAPTAPAAPAQAPQQAAAAGGGNAVAVAAPNDPSKIKIYILPLAEALNTGCVDKLTNIKATIHQDFSENGLGPLLDVHDDHHLHATSMFALEVIFHSRLKASQWFTSEPAQAHAVYIPYFPGLISTYPHCRGSKILNDIEEDVIKEVTGSPLWKTLGGTKFFTVAGLPESWFISGAKCAGSTNPSNTASSFLCDQRLAPVTVLLSQLAPSNEHTKRVGNPLLPVPAPSPIHFDPKMMETASFEPLSDAHASKRTIGMAYFKDDSKPHALNPILDEEIAAAKKDPNSLTIVPLNIGQQTAVGSGDWELRIVELMRRSKFCLFQPSLSSMNTLFMDSILLGCIPVVLEEPEKPFAERIHYDMFVESLPADKVASKSFSTVGHLSQLITKAAEMSKRLAEMRAASLHLQYAQPEEGSDLATLQSGKDAFNVAMDKLIAMLTASKP